MTGFTKCSSDQLVKLFIREIGKYDDSLSGRGIFSQGDRYALTDTAKELKKRCRSGVDQINPALEQFGKIFRNMKEEELSNPKSISEAFKKGFSYTTFTRAAMQKPQVLQKLAR